MNILILGAGGQTGLQLVQQAIDAGHKVTAFVRTPAKFTLRNSNLSIAVGDATDEQALTKALVGQEGVLVALGSNKITEKLMEPATIALITAMKAAHVARVVMMSSFAAHPDFKPTGIMYLLMSFGKAPFQDKAQAENLLKQSDLDWTIVYPARLTNGKRTGQYKIGMVAPSGIGPHISRADVADFMLKQIADNSSIHTSPVLHY